MVVTTSDYDKTIQSEVRSYFRMIGQDALCFKRVLDLGAHKGFFSAAALEHGASLVVAVEPFSDNFKVLKKNAPTAIVYHSACLGWRGGDVFLTMSPRMRSDAAFAVVRHHSTRIPVERVKVIRFWDIAQEHRIQIVKMDFQGAEWGVWARKIPTCVEMMFGEIHYSGRFEIGPGQMMKKSVLHNKTEINLILRNLKDQGFKLRFKKKGGWSSTPPWETKARFGDFIFERTK